GFMLATRSNSFTVSGGAYTLTVTPTSVQSGAQVTLTWSAPPGRPATHWIGLYSVGAPDTSFLWWQYTNGARAGKVTVTMPGRAGQYEFRYFVEDGYQGDHQQRSSGELRRGYNRVARALSCYCSRLYHMPLLPLERITTSWRMSRRHA